MTSESSQSQAINHPALTFNCPSCDKLLSVPQELAGSKGPCPSCGQIINAPASQPVCGEAADQSKNQRNSSRLPQISSRRRHILADSIVDQEHLERKETMKFVAIISLFILTGALCLGVAWFLQDWIAK